MEELENYAQKGNVKIEFHGRVVDQDGGGLSGVEVNYRVDVPTVKSMLTWSSNTKLGKVYSNADGTFEIHGIKGSGMSVGPFVKQGYRDGQKAPRGFSYIGSPELHNPTNVEEFLMVRDNVPRAKSLGANDLNFAWNKGEVKIPLSGGLGNLTLIPARDMPSGLAVGERKNFDWNLKVSMEKGELFSFVDRQSMLAPTDGYRKQYEYGYRKGDPNWGGGQERFAFKTQDGRYGVMTLNMYIERDDFDMNGYVDIRLNESSARNLD